MSLTGLAMNLQSLFTANVISGLVQQLLKLARAMRLLYSEVETLAAASGGQSSLVKVMPDGHGVEAGLQSSIFARSNSTVMVWASFHLHRSTFGIVGHFHAQERSESIRSWHSKLGSQFPA